MLPRWFEPRANLSEEDIESQFEQDFGHYRSFGAIQAILYQKGAGHLRRKRKDALRHKSQSSGSPVIEIAIPTPPPALSVDSAHGLSSSNSSTTRANLIGATESDVNMESIRRGGSESRDAAGTVRGGEPNEHVDCRAQNNHAGQRDREFEGWDPQPEITYDEVSRNGGSTDEEPSTVLWLDDCAVTGSRTRDQQLGVLNDNSPSTGKSLGLTDLPLAGVERPVPANKCRDGFRQSVGQLLN